MARREWSAFVRASVRRGRVWELVTPVLRAQRVRADRRRMPEGLVAFLPEAAPDRRMTPVMLPVPSGAPQPIASIPLATRVWPVADGVPWAGALTDPEDVFAAHRFSWVPVALVRHGGDASALANRWLRAWIAAHPGEDGPGWDAYSISERLVALAHVVATDGADAVITQAMETHRRVLLNRLEFRGVATNNHLLNNARALYLASVVLGLPDTLDYARGLARFGLSRFFVDGFLREGSSHYQGVLCRTLAELRWAARAAGDSAFEEEVNATLATAVARLSWFLGSRAFPMIGDTSPDLSPEDTGVALGRLLGSQGPAPTDAPALVSNAGFARISHSGWTVWAHAHPEPAIAGWSHAHADHGGIVATFDSDPVFIDAGRSTYADTPAGRFGRSVRSHSTVEIDGAEPCLIQGLNGYPELLPAAYLGDGSTLDARADSQAASIEVSHDGYARFGDSIGLRRTVAADRHGLHIADHVAGRGRHRVTSRFHVHPSAQVAREAGAWWLLLRSGRRVRVEGWEQAVAVRGVDGPDPMGWCSEQYGRREAASTIVLDQVVTLPTELHVRVVCVE